MFKLIQNHVKLQRSTFQCCCLSTLKKPDTNENDQSSANKTEVTSGQIPDIQRRTLQTNLSAKETSVPAKATVKSEESKLEEANKSITVTKDYRSPLVPPSKYDPNMVSGSEVTNWRTAWHQREEEGFMFLRSFNKETSYTPLLKMLHSPIDLRPSTIKKWLANRKENREIVLQSYLPQRNQILGNELAAAHFLVYRGGAVKFFDNREWIKKDKFGDYILPKFYEKDKVLQAIDCSGMNLYYEGLANLRDLKNVQWLRLSEINQVDDWFLDRISNIFRHSLIYLDIRNCPNFTERGLGALYKMHKLKILCIDDMLMTSSFEMTCLLLQDANPNLDIKIGNVEGD